MQIRVPSSWELPESAVTPEADYRKRRQFLKTLGKGVLGTALIPNLTWGATAGFPSKRNTRYTLPDLEPTDIELITSYNNFYEFSTDKGEVKKLANIQASELIYQREMESIREDHERTLRNQRLDMDTYLSFIGQTEEEWSEQLRPQAEERLATFLVMRKLAEQETIEVNPEDVDAEIDRLTENSAEESVESLRRVLNSEDSRESIRSSLLSRKVLAYLVEIARTNGQSEADGSDGDDGEPDATPEPEATAETDAASDGGEDSGDAPGTGEQSDE